MEQIKDNQIDKIDSINENNNKILKMMLNCFWIFLIFLWIWNSKWEPIHPIFDINPADLWDSINIFNGMVGAITVAFVYGAYHLQQEALDRQKEELKETREVLRQQEKEMQEQNRQQYIKFLLEQKNNMLEQLDFCAYKWAELFDYWAKKEFILFFRDNSIESLRLLIWRNSWMMEMNLHKFQTFYKNWYKTISNYKNLCYYIKSELEKSESTKNLTFLAISAEEQFCFDLMEWFDEYWKNKTDE